jgi:aminoglycoside/choline kinase family phosphotransferase
MKPELKSLVESYLQQLEGERDSTNRPQNLLDEFQVTPLSPDGSDRLYYRVTAPGITPFIATDASGCAEKDKNSGRSQNNSFRLIQQHLKKLNFPVPGYLTDESAGDDLYLLDDLGDTTLHSFVKTHGWGSRTITRYQEALKLLLRLQIDAAAAFNPDWAYAGGFYDFSLIVTRELNYFLEAFVINYCRIEITATVKANLAAEFKFLADTALQAPTDFFLYRDFQSKNLMLFQDKIFLIDFQGARLGPVYYDLAALINDPYTEIPLPLRQDLRTFYYNQLKDANASTGTFHPSPETFAHNFALFSLIRTLQTLGAFGWLTSCGKNHFAQYIRPALTNLTYYLKELQKHNADCKLKTLNLVNKKIGLRQKESCSP